MAINPATDIQLRLSTVTGSAGDSVAGAPATSLGKYMSTTATLAALNDLFDNISGAENAANQVDYRCFFVYNSHATLSWDNAVVFLQSEVAGGASLAFAVDNIGPVARNATAAQAAQIASDTTAPTGVGAFSTPTTDAAGLALGNIGPGQCRAVWVRRTASNSAAVNNDGGVPAFAGDTAA